LAKKRLAKTDASLTNLLRIVAAALRPVRGLGGLRDHTLNNPNFYPAFWVRYSPIPLLADCGGSNGYRVPLFPQQLPRLRHRLDRTFRVCHVPPYCSKYNPTDHRLFCHLSRSLRGLQLTSIEVVCQAMQQTTTRTALRVVCESSARLPAGPTKPG
jgi:hypothetical protein